MQMEVQLPKWTRPSLKRPTNLQVEQMLGLSFIMSRQTPYQQMQLISLSDRILNTVIQESTSKAVAPVSFLTPFVWTCLWFIQVYFATPS
jgi:hypothetical protein